MPPLDIADLVASSTRTARAMFYEAMAKLPEEQFMRVVLDVDSGAASHDYSFLGDIPAVREWLGDRTLSALSQHSFQIVNRRWESSVAIKLMTFRVDALGVVRTRVADLADAGRRHTFKMISDLLVNGTADTCFTGHPFFDNDHSFADSGAFDNLLAGTGATAALFSADWASAKAAMRKFPNSRAEPLNNVPDVAWVPAELEGAAISVAKATVLSSSTNVYSGEFTVVVDPNLSDPNDWYALCANRAMKAFIHQVNVPWRFSAVDNLADSYVFLNDEVLYGGDAYSNAGYGLPQLAAKTVNT